MSTGSFNRFVLMGAMLLMACRSTAQLFDSLEATAGVEYRYSSESYQPFLLIANKFGTVADRKSDFVSYASIKNTHVLAEHEYPNEIGIYDHHDLALRYGISVYNNNRFKSVFANEAYIKMEYRNWSLRGGRFRETTGEMDPDLSTGSFGISGNARPIPKIGIAVTDYTDVPFTKGYFQFKGTFAHGWFGNNRHVKGSYYHEKTFFLRFGPPCLKFYIGLEHFAEWGGASNDQQFDRSMTAFKKILFAKTGTDEIPTGDQRGVLDGGFTWEREDFTILTYFQKLFEGKKDVGFRTMNGIAGAQLSLKNKETGLQKILLEVISTKGINNHIPVNQQKSYYNSDQYKTGWEYDDFIIGTPLFLNRARAQNYFPAVEPFDWDSTTANTPGNSNIISNRVFAIHAGGLYNITPDVTGKTLITLTGNYGTPENNVSLIGRESETYCLQQFSINVPERNLKLTAGIGVDFGDLSTATVVGILFGVEWSIPIIKKRDFFQ